MESSNQDEKLETCVEFAANVSYTEESGNIDKVPNSAFVKACEISETTEKISDKIVSEVSHTKDHTDLVQINSESIYSIPDHGDTLVTSVVLDGQALCKLDPECTSNKKHPLTTLSESEPCGLQSKVIFVSEELNSETRKPGIFDTDNSLGQPEIVGLGSGIQEQKFNNNTKESNGSSSRNNGTILQPSNSDHVDISSDAAKVLKSLSGFVETVNYSDADIKFSNLSSGKSLIEQILSIQSGESVNDSPDIAFDHVENTNHNKIDRCSTSTQQENEESISVIKQVENQDSNNTSVAGGANSHASLVSIPQSGSDKTHEQSESKPKRTFPYTITPSKRKREINTQSGELDSVADNKPGGQEHLVSPGSESCDVRRECEAGLGKSAIENRTKNSGNHSGDESSMTVHSTDFENSGKNGDAILPVNDTSQGYNIGFKENEEQRLKQEDVIKISCDLKEPSVVEEMVVKVAQSDVYEMKCDTKEDLSVADISSNYLISSLKGKPIRQAVKEYISGANVNISSVESTAEVQENVEPSILDEIQMEYEEPEFIWEDYLTETGAQPAIHESFLHVETSLKNGFEAGQVVEVAVKEQNDIYWFARVVTVSGQLLGLCYVNSLDFLQPQEEDEDSDGELEEVDFWCDAFNSDLHPLGWCAENNKTLVPPKDIEGEIPNVAEFLSVLQSAPTPASYLFKFKFGTTPVDFIRVGHWLEVQEELFPTHIWPVRIIENVGGRLLLRYEGAKNATRDFWLFYLNIRLHELGWCKNNQRDGYQYEAPTFLTSDPELQHINWNELLAQTFNEGETYKIPVNIFQEQEILKEHCFKEGMKLEALHPQLGCAICPATVTKVFNKYFFTVQIDSVPSETSRQTYEMCCHHGSPNIFPVRWCVHSGLRLVPPIGWNNAVPFDWKEYIQNCGGEASPEKAFDLEVPDHEFSRGMKLEAIDPNHPAHLCVATIVRIVEQLMWLHLDSSSKVGSSHIVDVQSHDIFPVGWCESNNYPLKLPKKTGAKRQITSNVQVEKPMTADEYRSAAFKQIRKGEGSDWCPKIYFNHLCFSGGFLSKGRIAELPRSVGPGPVSLVMKEVLTMLINVAYKSSRVLREIQVEGTPNPAMTQQVLKAKHKGKRYRAVVEMCRYSDQIEEFCRQVCIKLECCPLLISPYCVQGECPESCSQLTKTKYTACYLKNKTKRKQGRPPGGHSNLEGPRKAPGRKKKRKRGRPPMNKDATQNGYGHHDNNLAENESVCGSLDSSERLDDEVASIISKDVEDDTPRKKRKYDRRVLPPTTVKTRGVKLPSFGTIQHEKRGYGSKPWKVKDILLTNDNGASVVMAEEFIRTGKKGRPRKVQTMIPVLNSTNSGSNSTVSTVTSPPTTTTVFKPIYTFKDEATLKLTTNPLYWNVQQVVDFIRGTDSAQFAKILKDQEIDGQALLMLSLPVVQEYLDYKLGPALKLCHHIERLKLAFYQQFT